MWFSRALRSLAVLPNRTHFLVGSAASCAGGFFGNAGGVSLCMDGGTDIGQPGLPSAFRSFNLVPRFLIDKFGVEHLKVSLTVCT